MKKNLLELKDMQSQDIQDILVEAKKMRAIMNAKKYSECMRSKSVVNVFFENSTRTALSFELATKTLGGAVSNMSINTSSVNKGENLFDTVNTLQAIGYDCIVVRHMYAGVPQFIAKTVDCSVINAGDGTNEHPTQSLLDMRTMLDYHKSLKGLKVAIIGDIKHSRVAKSNIYGLAKMGAEVYVAAPKTLMPKGIESFPIKLASVIECVKNANVVMTLRLQKERMQTGLIPSLSQYATSYGINDELLRYADKNALVMHPGPVNRNVEMTTNVLDGKQSVVTEQVTNGVAVRMAVLKWCCL